LILLDSSALVKRYADEIGSELVARHMREDGDWTASELARTETEIALCRLGPEGGIGSPLRRLFAEDWDRFLAVPLDAACLRLASELGCEHPLRTLDAIHLAAALRLPGEVRFLSFDRRQTEVATILGLSVIPTGT